MSAQAATVHTIPGNNVAAIHASSKLKIDRSTYTSATWTHGEGQEIAYGTDIRFMLNPIPTVGNPIELHDFLDVNFQNVGSVSGRQMDVTIHFDSVRVTAAADDGSPHPCVFVIPETGTSWVGGFINSYYIGDIVTTITVKWHDNGQEVDLPFYHLVSDIDVQFSPTGFIEGATFGSGYTGDFYVFADHNLTMSGNTFRVLKVEPGVPDEASSLNGDDSILKGGVFAPTYSGSVQTTWYCGTDAGMELELYTPFMNLKAPTKSILN